VRPPRHTKARRLRSLTADSQELHSSYICEAFLNFAAAARWRPAPSAPEFVAASRASRASRFDPSSALHHASPRPNSRTWDLTSTSPSCSANLASPPSPSQKEEPFSERKPSRREKASRRELLSLRRLTFSREDLLSPRRLLSQEELPSLGELPFGGRRSQRKRQQEAVRLVRSDRWKTAHAPERRGEWSRVRSVVVGRAERRDNREVKTPGGIDLGKTLANGDELTASSR